MDPYAYDGLVEDYSSRELTYAGDRLDASQAIIFTFLMEGVKPLGQPRAALWGLPPGENFFWALVWRSIGISTRVTANTRLAQALPSWSWVVWSGRVTYVSGWNFAKCD